MGAKLAPVITEGSIALMLGSIRWLRGKGWEILSTSFLLERVWLSRADSQTHRRSSSCERGWCQRHSKGEQRGLLVREAEGVRHLIIQSRNGAQTMTRQVSASYKWLILIGRCQLHIVEGGLRPITKVLQQRRLPSELTNINILEYSISQ